MCHEHCFYVLILSIFFYNMSFQQCLNNGKTYVLYLTRGRGWIFWVRHKDIPKDRSAICLCGLLKDLLFLYYTIQSAMASISRIT